MPGLLDNRAAAEFLGVTPATLKGLRLRRLVPCVRLSRKVVRYDRRDLERYIARQRIAATWERI